MLILRCDGALSLKSFCCLNAQNCGIYFRLQPHYTTKEILYAYAISNSLAWQLYHVCPPSTSCSEWIIFRTEEQTWYNYFIPPTLV